MRRIGAVFQPAFPPERLRAAAEAADRSGVPKLWLWEDCFKEGAFASASAVLAWTEHLRVGLGIIPMPLRNVAVTAMEIATIARLFPDRFLPGVGHGVLDWMGQTGSRVASPLTLMREYIPALRGLLDGEELTTSGRYIGLDRVALDWPPAHVPELYAAGEGPKTLRLTGALADGTILTGGTSIEQVRAAVDLIGEGRAHAGRSGRNEIVVYVLAAFGPGAQAQIEREASEWGVIAEAPSVALGSTADVAGVAEQFFAAGADAVILQPTTDEPDFERFLAHVGEVAAAVGEPMPAE